jgi:hypothetical protein
MVRQLFAIGTATLCLVAMIYINIQPSLIGEQVIAYRPAPRVIVHVGTGVYARGWPMAWFEGTGQVWQNGEVRTPGLLVDAGVALAAAGMCYLGTYITAARALEFLRTMRRRTPK